MPVLNPNFEDAGLLPGAAEHWTLESTASLEAIAGFGADPELAWEGFERWVELWLPLDDVSVVRAFFDTSPEGIEDFDEVWENDLYLWELPPAQQLPASFGPEEVEDYEGGWANDSYATSWVEVAGVVGVFDGEAREDFEDLWSGNQAFAWTWGAVTSETALFDAGAQAREDFENGWSFTTTI